jgi:DNA-directed RNA polymerase specialized sigma24 family protein
MSASDPFETTHWSLILAARDCDEPRANEALASLCQSYWQPIYAYIRRNDHDPHAAEYLTQGFFASLLEPGALAGVDREKGKFRAFLLASCRHFLGHQRDHDHALKRGGGGLPLSIDARDAEGRYLREPADNLTPEALFVRRWAFALLEGVLDDLRDEYTKAGKSEQFDALKATLTGDSRSTPYAEIAGRIGMTEGAVQVAVHRLRGRYRLALRSRIAATVADPADIEEEIRDLFAALSS